MAQCKGKRIFYVVVAVFEVSPGVHKNQVKPETFASLSQWVQDVIEKQMP